FALVYFVLLSWDGHGSLKTGGQLVGKDFNGFLNLVYYSIVTSTATGFGDITPLGLSKLVTVIEITLGLLVFGVLISKLISVKQERILEELYDLSFEETIRRLRSGLYISRSDIISILNRIRNEKVSKKNVSDFDLVCATLSENLIDVIKVVCQAKKSDFTKVIDDFNLELVINSLRLTLEKLKKAVIAINKGKVEWKTKSIIENLDSISSSSKKIYEYHIRKKHGKEIVDKLELIKELSSAITEEIK
ncbi:two pore domain potassium channel family protein, partial [Candidatus Woesearchaeota archaeon]|nr:two pore domain potassium channel family protein [Candidatus Woesearchaeota archaeon]